METEKGKVKLERPVFPYKGDLIVPMVRVGNGKEMKPANQEIGKNWAAIVHGIEIMRD
ncbi:MAG: hypothetical protein ACUVTP_13400 [Candidatus Fervidibacter sp.]|uniref:hypothetical protein n=1 Tax=Candidatus Fervidibacter sp. TaxID=3100871 RepID=UPI00404960C9